MKMNKLNIYYNAYKFMSQIYLLNTPEISEIR